MLEKNNKVMNVGRVKFTELVLDLLQLLTFEELHYSTPIIIKQVTCQEGITSTKGIFKKNCIKRANKVLLAFREIKDIFASGVQSTSFVINLLISSIDS